MTLVLTILLLIAVALGAAALSTRSLAAKGEAAVPQAGRIRPVQGGSLHYIDEGPRDAQAIVLIHGLGGQLQHFTYRLAPLLTDAFRVIAVDRPGCGWSDRDSDARAAIPQQARMIGDLLVDLGVESPVVVGHSLGGAIALAMALDRPDKTGALALLCPLTHDAGEIPPMFKGLAVTSPGLRRLLGHTIAAPMALRTAPATLTAVFAPEPWPEDFLSHGGGALGLRPKGFITASADMTAVPAAIVPQVARYPEELKTPGGVLYGAEDHVLDPKVHGEPMAAFGLDYEALAGKGHMIPMTEPEACADFIRRMAAKARPSSAAAE